MWPEAGLGLGFEPLVIPILEVPSRPSFQAKPDLRSPLLCSTRTGTHPPGFSFLATAPFSLGPLLASVHNFSLLPSPAGP